MKLDLRMSIDRSTALALQFGSVVVIVADASEEDLRAAATLRGRYGSLTIVHIDRSAWDPSAPVGNPPNAPVLRITRDNPFQDAWNAHVAAGRRGPVHAAMGMSR